jgi:hypothetical protein
MLAIGLRINPYEYRCEFPLPGVLGNSVALPSKIEAAVNDRRFLATSSQNAKRSRVWLIGFCSVLRSRGRTATRKPSSRREGARFLPIP